MIAAARGAVRHQSHLDAIASPPSEPHSPPRLAQQPEALPLSLALFATHGPHAVYYCATPFLRLSWLLRNQRFKHYAVVLLLKMQSCRPSFNKSFSWFSAVV